MLKLRYSFSLLLSIFLFTARLFAQSPVRLYFPGPNVPFLFRQDQLSAVFGNPALADSGNFCSAGLYSSRTAMLSECTEAGVAAGVSLTENSRVTVGYMQRGFELYRNFRACMAFTRSFGKQFSAGLRTEYSGVFYGEGYGTSTAYCISPGLFIQLSPKMDIACIFRTTIEEKFGEQSQLSFGMKLHPSKTFSIELESVYRGSKTAIFGSLTYRSSDKSEISLFLTSASLGTGFSCKVWMKSYSLMLGAVFQRYTGVSPMATVGFWK